MRIARVVADGSRSFSADRAWPPAHIHSRSESWARSSRRHALRGSTSMPLTSADELRAWGGGSHSDLPPQPAALHPFARQLAGLLHPVDELRFVEIVLVDVEVADFLVLPLARRDGPERRAAEERNFDVLREAMDVEEPAFPGLHRSVAFAFRNLRVASGEQRRVLSVFGTRLRGH